MNYTTVIKAFTEIQDDDKRRLAFLIELRANVKTAANDLESIAIRLDDEIEALAERQGLNREEEHEVPGNVEVRPIKADVREAREALARFAKVESKRKPGRPRKAKG